MKRAVKIIFFYVIPTLVVFLIIGLMLLPTVAKKYINQHGKDYSGRQLSVNQIRINYFTATIRLIDFKMAEADGLNPFVSFDTLMVDINPLRLFSSELNLEQIRLVKPEVTIVRKDSLFNFDDILAFFKSKSEADTVNEPSKPLKYVVNNISMEKGKLTFSDLGVAHTSIMQDIGFTIPYISYNQQEASEAGIKFHLANGGTFQVKAAYNQGKGLYNAEFTVNQLDVAPFFPYTKDYFRLKSFDGIVDGNLHLNGSISYPDSVLMRGNVDVTDFAAYDPDGRKVLGTRRANVVLLDSYPVKSVFMMNKITLTEPYLFFEMKDSTNNFLNLMVDSGTEEQSSDYYYNINHFNIDSGLLDFRDNSYGEPFDYHLDQISMKVDSVTSTTKWLTAYSTMRLNQRGKLKAELGINPSDPYELKVNYVITNFQLSDLSPYSRYFVGFPIVLGNMYYQGKTVITARQLTSENKLIVRNAKLGKKSGGLMNLPLKLALYLLKDIHGDIILDLPLAGDLNDPKTKIGKLIWQVLKNVVIKVVASPFRALSGLMGVDPDEIKGIQFNYGDTTLTDSHLRRIRLFIQLEKKKPDMKIEMAYYNDVELEKRDIAVAEAGRLFNRATGADPGKEKTRFAAFLAQKLQSDTINPVSGSIQLIGIQKLDSIQLSYSQKRLRKIEAALHAVDDSTRIKVIIPNKEVPENVGSRPVFELKYSIDE